jgi:hypothetical protein
MSSEIKTTSPSEALEQRPHATRRDATGPAATEARISARRWPRCHRSSSGQRHQPPQAPVSRLAADRLRPNHEAAATVGAPAAAPAPDGSPTVVPPSSPLSHCRTPPLVAAFELPQVSIRPRRRCSFEWFIAVVSNCN